MNWITDESAFKSVFGGSSPQEGVNFTTVPSLTGVTFGENITPSVANNYSQAAYTPAPAAPKSSISQPIKPTPPPTPVNTSIPAKTPIATQYPNLATQNKNAATAAAKIATPATSKPASSPFGNSIFSNPVAGKTPKPVTPAKTVTPPKVIAPTPAKVTSPFSTGKANPFVNTSTIWK